MTFRFVLVLAAGGSGRRFGSEVPKAFIPLAGRPLLLWSIATFRRIEGFAGVVASVPKAMKNEAERVLAPFGATVVAGGRRRQDSVVNALAVVDDTIDLVAVHDAARPVVSLCDIKETLKKAFSADGAVLSRPLTDTVKRVKGTRISDHVDRSGLWRVETPQVFKTQVLKEAFAKWDGGDATDDTQVAVANGADIHVVHAHDYNPKITFPADLVFLEKHLKSS